MPPLPILIDINKTNLHAVPCCGIQNPAHPGLVSKRLWLMEHFKLGLKARVLMDEDGKPCGYIEYLPGEHAWRGVNASGYMFIHCIWNHSKRNRSKGWASAMVEACVADTRVARMSGIAVMTRQGPWMAGGALFKENGFEIVEVAPPDYQLWVRKLKPRATNPSFKKEFASKAARMKNQLTIVRSAQCPYIAKFTAQIVETAEQEYGIRPHVIDLASYEQAQDAPTPYAVFSIISKGRVLADHQISRTRFRNIMKVELANTR